MHRFPDAAAARDWLLGFLAETGGPSLWAPGPFLEACGRPEAPGLGFEVTRAAATAAKVGISQMDWALADTGTLAQDATTVEQRLVSTLPEIHVAAVAADRMLPGLGDLLARSKPERAGYLALITGPSRTADIERVLTIGVHGPSRLVILVIEGLLS